RSLEERRTQALKSALGTNRFAQFQLLHEATYRDAYAAALEAGVPEAAATVYEINRAAQEEIARIKAQTNLSQQELAIERKEAELAQMKGTAQALGKVSPEIWPQQAPSPPVTQVTKPHVLTAGEGLEFLSTLYGVTVGDLRAANPNLDPTKLKASDV